MKEGGKKEEEEEEEEERMEKKYKHCSVLIEKLNLFLATLFLHFCLSLSSINMPTQGYKND